MLNIYLSDSSGRLEEIEHFSKGCWVHLVNPSQEEIFRIVNELNIDSEFIKDALDDEERSRIEKEEDATFIVIDVPHVMHDEHGTSTYETIPLGMIVHNDFIITVTLKDNPIFERFMYNKVRDFYTFKKTRFVLQLLYTISSYFLRYLKQINRRTDEIEKELHQSLKNQELFTMLSLEKSLVYFTTSLRANYVVIQKMMRTDIVRMYPDDEELLDEVIIEVKQAIEMAETYLNIINGMMDAFASVISNNLNIVMKFLTSITIVISLPTLVSSFFGMNVEVPLQHHPYGFVIVMGISGFISGVTAFIFWKKKYF
ncbi:MAG: magnesium transporter CorA family protein [Bacilli bacterium]